MTMLTEEERKEVERLKDLCIGDEAIINGHYVLSLLAIIDRITEQPREDTAHHGTPAANGSGTGVGNADEAIGSLPPVAPSPAPETEWRCFHCDEVFTDREAAKAHFGPDEGEECACVMAASDKGLLGLYREAREQLDAYHREDTESYKEYYRLGAAHSTALREAEQTGYDKGLADGRALRPAAPGVGGKCSYCHGRGYVPGDPEGAPIEDCPKCSKPTTPTEATGEVEAARNEAGRMIEQIDTKNVPLLDWNKRVRAMCVVVLRKLRSPTLPGREWLAKWFAERQDCHARHEGCPCERNIACFCASQADALIAALGERK